MTKRLIVGKPVQIPGLIYAPVNELGVIFLFAKYNKELGIESIEGIRNYFPDAVGIRKIGKGIYERVNIEFEFRSSGFKTHLKDLKPDEKYIVVCWEHDWKDCPKELQVIELKTAIPELIEKGKVSNNIIRLRKRQKEYQEFFEDVLRRFKRELPDVTKRKALPYSWCSIPLGTAGIHLEWCISGRFPNRSLSTELHLERRSEEENKKLFDALRNERKSLEKELGPSLYFQYPWAEKWARIYQVKMYNASDRREVEEVKEWAVKTMVNFYKVFRPKLQRITAYLR